MRQSLGDCDLALRHALDHAFGRRLEVQVLSHQSFDKRGQLNVPEAFPPGDVDGARQDGSFKEDISAEFAAMCFYGAIEQLLSGWIFGYLPTTDEAFERAKSLVVETICGGLESPGAGAPANSG